MVMTIDDLSAGLKTWGESNPLKAWRKAHGVKATHAAIRLGVSNYTIYVWENGSSNPSDESFEKIERLTGQDLRAAWRSWMDGKPS